jgi:hypothetical protein
MAHTQLRRFREQVNRRLARKDADTESRLQIQQVAQILHIMANKFAVCAGRTVRWLQGLLSAACMLVTANLPSCFMLDQIDLLGRLPWHGP